MGDSWLGGPQDPSQQEDSQEPVLVAPSMCASTSVLKTVVHVATRANTEARDLGQR